MKTLILLFSFLLSLGIAQAQPGAFVLSADRGEALTLYINGALINEIPATQIFSGPLDPGGNRMRVIIHLGADEVEVVKSGYVEPGMLYYVTVMQNRKGDYVLRDYNAVPWQGAMPAEFVDRDYTVHEVMTAPGSTTTTTTQTTRVTVPGTQTQVREDGDNVDVRISVPGFRMNVRTDGGGVSMDMDVREDELDALDQSFPGGTTTTTTRTTTTGTPPQTQRPATPPARTPSRSGCAAPMSDAAFGQAQKSISDKGFDETRLTVAKQILSSNCLLSKDVATVMGLFSFEETRLDFAKFAYGRTFDPENYFLVNDAFSFSSSIDELNKHIATQRR